MKLLCASIVVSVFATSELSAQSSFAAATVIVGNPEHFEHILRTLSSSSMSGGFQQAFFDHLGLAPEDRVSARQVGAEFRSDEQVLEKDVLDAVRKRDVVGQASLRNQRTALIQQSAAKLLQRLTPAGRAQVLQLVQRAASDMPVRVAR